MSTKRGVAPPQIRESVRATMRSKIRRLLAKYDYPPDREDNAVELVLQRAELLAGSGAVT